MILLKSIVLGRTPFLFVFSITKLSTNILVTRSIIPGQVIHLKLGTFQLVIKLSYPFGTSVL